MPYEGTSFVEIVEIQNLNYVLFSKKVQGFCRKQIKFFQITFLLYIFGVPSAPES